MPESSAAQHDHRAHAQPYDRTLQEDPRTTRAQTAMPVHELPRAPATGRSPHPQGVPSTHELPRAPSIGRVASTWRRHLASTDWPRPSLVADCGLIGPLAVTAASTVGRGHAHRQQQRQDAYGFKMLADVLVCAVADGVSEAVLGGPAADVAVSSALTSMSLLSTDADAARSDLRLLELAAHHAGREVYELAQRLLPGDALAEQHCALTLLLAAVRVLDRRDGMDGCDMHVSVVSVGDSSVIELGADGAARVIMGPAPSTRSQELRDYLPRSASIAVRKELVVAAGSLLLLATDGLAQDMRQSPAVCAWVGDQLRRATSTVAAAHVLSYQRQRSSDDLTFVAVRPIPPE